MKISTFTGGSQGVRVESKSEQFLDGRLGATRPTTVQSYAASDAKQHQKNPL